MQSFVGQDVFAALIEHCQEAIALIQTEGRVSYVSPAITRMLGYSTDEFVESDLFTIVHSEERAELIEHIERLQTQADNEYSHVNRLSHKDGSWRWIEWVFKNRLVMPQVGSIVVTLRDVTEHKQIADSLRESEEKFRNIVESATGFAIVTIDLAGCVSSWNSGAQRLLGYDEAEVLGKDCGIFFTPEDNATQQPESEMRDAIADGRGTDERWHIKKDGSRFWGSGLMMPLRDDNGAIHGYLKIFRDMTRAYLAEEAMKDASRKKDEFLAMLAHELRNPLAAISNASALLVTSAADDSTVRWAQDMISRQSRYFARLLDDLLDYSRITQGKIRLHRENVLLSSLILRAVEIVKPLVDQKQHRLVLEIAPGEVPVFGDPLRIEQILVILLGNAAKYTEPNGHITIAAVWNEEAVVRVRDNGIGIEPELLRRIFEPFVQAETSLDRPMGGIGIGLTLAQSLVDLHGGILLANSDGLGFGSEFVVALPLAAEQAPKKQSE